MTALIRTHTHTHTNSCLFIEDAEQPVVLHPSSLEVNSSASERDTL